MTLSEGIQAIRENAFQFAAIKRITLPEGLTSIGKSAFFNCNSVRRYVFPSTLARIGDSAFRYGQFLNNVFFLGDAPTVFGKTVFNKWEGYAAPTLHYASGTDGWTSPTWTAPDGTVYATSMFDPAVLTDPYACGNNAFWSYENGTLTVTGSGAIWNFSGDEAPWQEYIKQIQTVIVTEGIGHIGNYAFRNASALQTVSLPDSLTSIGDNAFWSCPRLDSLTIPASVSSIGNYAFRYCGRLKDAYFLGDVPETFGSSVFTDTVLHYIEGKSGWTTPTWVAPDGTEYTTATFVPETGDVPGDINGDGVFNYADITKLYACYTGKAVADADLCDYNGDGVFDYYDVARLYADYRKLT